jgi:hypothetical protein
MISKSRLLIFGKQSGRSIIISKNFGKIFGYALSVPIFLGKIFRKKAYILCVYIERRVVGDKKEGSKNRGVQI